MAYVFFRKATLEKYVKPLKNGYFESESFVTAEVKKPLFRGFC